MAFFWSVVLATIWASALFVGRPAYRFRRRTRWLVRPQAEVVGPQTFAADVGPVIDRAGDELHGVGFDPFVTARTFLGHTAGRQVWQFQSVYLRPSTADAAVVDWQQMSAARSGTWPTDVHLYLVRWLEPTGRRTSRLSLADGSGTGGKLAWVAAAGEVAAAYEAFAAAPQASATKPWRYADRAAYVSALGDLVAEQMAQWTAGKARPDRAGRWYRYTWPSAIGTTLRHLWGPATPRPTGRGFEVIPLASLADQD